MPSEFRNQKNLAEWVELDYFNRPRGLRRLYNVLPLVVLLLGAGAVLAVAFFYPRSSLLVQAGPVSPAHAMFNEDCAQCHQEAFRTAKKVVDWSSSLRAIPDGACIRCHDGPPHNDPQAEQMACATCHREHRGRLMLARVPDRDCVVCHADLKKHRRDGEVGLRFQDVTAFTDDHPEFRFVRDGLKDPGQLHFNHKAHLGLLDAPADRFRVIADPLAALKEQQCAYCHLPDETGRHMRPINYEKHCAACHPLSVPLVGEFNVPRDQRGRLDRKRREFSPAPHKEPRVVRAVLRDRLLDLVQEFALVPREPERPGLIEPKVLGKRHSSLPGDPPTEAEWAWADRHLEPAERLLFPNRQLPISESVLFNNGGGCRFCHVVEEKPGGKGRAGVPQYRPTDITRVWFAHARFDHHGHRMLACDECHGGARDSKETSDLLLPALGTCQKCHNPTVGVRSDCAECHKYHDPVRPGATRGHTIDETLGR